MRKIILLVLAISCYGCASSGNFRVPSVPQDEEGLYFALGIGQSLKMDVALEKAKGMGRTELMRKFEIHTQILREQIQSEDRDRFNLIAKAAIEGSMRGSGVIKREFHDMKDGTIRAYVVMQVPTAPYNEKLVEEIKRDKELYEQFRDQQDFKRLGDAMKDLRERHSTK